jgi:excisionase family DNA binding protein
MEKIYTSNEVAMMLHMHRNTILKYIRSGKLKASNISSEAKPRYRITEENLDKFWETLQK